MLDFSRGRLEQRKTLQKIFVSSNESTARNQLYVFWREIVNFFHEWSF